MVSPHSSPGVSNRSKCCIHSAARVDLDVPNTILPANKSTTKHKNVSFQCRGRTSTFKVLVSLFVALTCFLGSVPVTASNLNEATARQQTPLATSSASTLNDHNEADRWKRQAPAGNFKITGFRLVAESESGKILEFGEHYTVKNDAEVEMYLFGEFGPVTNDSFSIGFTTYPQSGDDAKCNVLARGRFNVQKVKDDFARAIIKLSANAEPYFMCYSLNGHDYLYSQTDEMFQIHSEADFIPIWLQLICIAILLFMSGIFSGLNLGLMALDKNELQVIERCGTEQEKAYARTIAPVRKRGNYLLCTLLLGNVLVNSTLTIFMDSLTSGFFAVIVSTLSIVVFGEIIPQALCSRHGLAVGSRTIYITYVFMIITMPLSYPISMLLDKVLGEEIGNVYDRERLMEYIKVTKDYNRLEVEEMNIISGALRFKNIKVADVMTQIDDVFMLQYDSILNFDTLTLINNSGYSRIPVYEGERDRIVGLLHVKDLSLIDPDHNLPLKAILDFYSHPLFYVYEDVTLDIMLNEFKKGKSHMALVRRVIDNGVNDPFYELLGVVTLEDIIEELIQAEINDETDVISDNRRKQKRKDVQSRSNYLEFIKSGFNEKLGDIDIHENVIVSPQLALAAFRFLASSVEPFRPEYVSEEVLKVLMARDIYFLAKGESRKMDVRDMSPENVLYIRGSPADYFIMILEGRARIIVTKENQEYDTGPFYCFGLKALTLAAPNVATASSSNLAADVKSDESSPAASPVNTAGADFVGSTSNISQVGPKDEPFLPDFTLFCTERVVYLKVTRALYQQAIRTTYIEKQRSNSEHRSTTCLDTLNEGVCESDVKINMDSVTAGSKDRKQSMAVTALANFDSVRLRKLSMATNLPDSSSIALAAESALQKDSADAASSPDLARRYDQANLNFTVRSLDEINGGSGSPAGSRVVSYLQDDLYRTKPPSALSGVGRTKKKSLSNTPSDAAMSSDSPHELTPLSLVDAGPTQPKNQNGSLKHLTDGPASLSVVTGGGGGDKLAFSATSTKSVSDNEDESSQLL